MKYNATKVFNVTYNNVTEPHTCGHVTLDNGQEIGRYSGNIFDGYRCIINTDGHRAYISGATLSHLRRKTWHWLVDNNLTPGQKNRRIKSVKGDFTKAKAEKQERYNARCKELEAEALAQMPYKVGDTVKSRDGVAGRVMEMYPEVTGDIDSPHLIYEYDGKPTVNVVILDADGKRHCAHWSFFTLQEASEIKEFFTKGKKYRCIKSVKNDFTKGKQTRII